MKCNWSSAHKLRLRDVLEFLSKLKKTTLFPRPHPTTVLKSLSNLSSFKVTWFFIFQEAIKHLPSHRLTNHPLEHNLRPQQLSSHSQVLCLWTWFLVSHRSAWFVRTARRTSLLVRHIKMGPWHGWQLVLCVSWGKLTFSFYHSVSVW